MNTAKQRTRKRHGVATVEFATVLPLFVLLLLGTVEASRAVMVQHSIHEATRAGCRIYTIGDATQQDARDMIDQALADTGLTGYTVSFEPATKAEITETLQPVTVTISIPSDEVMWLSPFFINGGTISSRCTMPSDLDA